MSIKNSNAPDTTVTYNRNELDEPTETSTRPFYTCQTFDQINEELRTELFEKLEEFATLLKH